MSLPINIKELLNGKVVEWERLEFKKSWNPKSTMHTICAFANDINNWSGGYIIIGVEENNGKPVFPPYGLEQNQLDSIQKKLHEICYRLSPKYFPVVEPYFYEKKHILIVWVPGGDARPYKAPETLKKGSQYFTWIRRYSKSVKAKGKEEQLLFNLTTKTPFDDRINYHAEIDDFELILIKNFLKEINSDFKIQNDTTMEEVCHILQIGRGPKEYFKPLNIGLLFFTSDPSRYFPYARIEIVEFLDDIGDNLIEKTFTGPLHTQILSALQYIKNSVIKEKVKKIAGQAESNRFYNYPYEAIEEALVNAVYHKSYEIREPIEVSIRQDRIEILSFPGPLPPINNDSLKKYSVTTRCYRNRRIGDFLKELHLTEGRATGFPKVRRSMKINGSPDPIFQMDNDRIYFLTTIKINPDFKFTTPHVTPQATPQATPQVHRLLKYIIKEMTRSELMEVIELKDRKYFAKNYLQPALKKGFIEMTIPDKSTSPDQKYRLTKKGKILLEEIK